MSTSRRMLSRRTMLRGAAGVFVGLPLLEAMTPPVARAATAATLQPKRLSVLYTPNGLMMPNFVPQETGANYAITRTLKPLEAYRDRFAVVTGLQHNNGNALGDGGGDHARASASYLTAVHPKKTGGYDIKCGMSMDQLVAQQLGKDTPLASLELGIEQPSLLGSCDSGYSCSYTNTISWRSETTPLPVFTNPRDAFERLFGYGDNLDKQTRLAQLQERASILDAVMSDAKDMARSISATDQRKLDEYFESIRDIEKRIQIAEVTNQTLVLPDLERPTGVPETFADHVRLMMDLQVIAMQADLTRVSTFMMGRELSMRSYPEIGVSDAHHSVSHHGNDPEKLEALTKINVFHMELVAYLMKRMTETKDGEGTLMDTTLLIAGPGLGDPNTHDHMDLPVLVSGPTVQGNRHIAAREVPFANLMVSAMNIVGVNETSFGDSTGAFKGLQA